MTPNVADHLGRLLEEVERGIFNDDTLLLSIATAHSLTLTELKSRFIQLEVCPDCSQLKFAVNLRSVYAGMRYVCLQCLKVYEYCRECNSYRLVEDNELHLHSRDIRDNAAYNRPMEFNVDVMGGDDGPRFLRTENDRDPKWSMIQFVGVEIELEKQIGRILPPDLILKAYKSLPDGFIIVKRDGSLAAAPGDPRRGSNGFEIVSVPSTLDYHRKVAGWDRFFKVMAPWMQNNAPTTGLHFHLSANSMTSVVIGRITQFINDNRNLQFLKVIAGRDFTVPNPNGKVYAGTFPNHAQKVREVVSRRIHSVTCPMNPVFRILRNYYGGVQNLKVDAYNQPIIVNINPTNSGVVTCDCLRGAYDYEGHYAALNLRTNRPTIEFRMFQATTDSLQFFAAMEFCCALSAFCESKSFSEMTAEDFISWFRSNQHLYRSLRDFLIIAGFIQSKKVK